MNEALTVGVVGHVDHGKTALVRALTGIETDRLKEERERGLSIVLGFSYLETEIGTIDLIDVPGHEDFIRAMISGATGLDGILLVVAANEGLMPQTREHFDIARLLGVDRGVVVITKTDLVDENAVSKLRKDIGKFTEGSFLEDAPVLTASSVTGVGLDDIGLELAELAREPIERVTDSGFYMPLDRVFTMRGFGVVATGTLRGGPIRSNARVEVLPGGRTGNVRALQTHNRATETALPGQRVAVNFRNLDRNDVKRGDTIAEPGLLRPSTRIDVELNVLETAPALKNGAAVRLLLGTSEAIAKLRLLEARELAPGSTGFVQLRCDRDIVTHSSERFVIRSYSPMVTIGGGRILDANPPRHRRFDTAVHARLATALGGAPVDVLRQRLSDAGVEGHHAEAVLRDLGISRDALDSLVGEAGGEFLNDQLVVSSEAFARLRRQILDTLADFHESSPHRQGMARAGLEHALTPTPSRSVFDRAVEMLAHDGEIEAIGDVVQLTDFDPMSGLDERERERAGGIERVFREAGLMPPSVDQIIGANKLDRHLYKLLLDYGRLVELKTYDRKQRLVLHADTIDDVRSRIEESFPPPAKFAVRDIRDLLGSTRKFVVPLMEHFDSTGFTIRMGDFRQLRTR